MCLSNHTTLYAYKIQVGSQVLAMDRYPEHLVDSEVGDASGS